jgi:hypothetical protein
MLIEDRSDVDQKFDQQVLFPVLLAERDCCVSG